MNIQDELTLSFYKELSVLSKNKEVYLVQHTGTGVIYVKKSLKIFNSDIYRQLQKLNLPGIPQIYECIEDSENLYIIEEYIHGRTLDSIFNDSGVFTNELVCSLTAQLCQILHRLHTCNPPIIHRDIKPSNLILTTDDKLKLIDFNAAKNYTEGASKDTMLLGTQNFAAPEQYGFSQSDIRTDIYGIGVTMNYLLTGKYPNEEIYQGSLHNLLDKCLRMSPSERYSNCEELIKDIPGYDIKKSTANMTGTGHGLFSLTKYYRIIIACVVLIIVLILIMLLGTNTNPTNHSPAITTNQTFDEDTNSTILQEEPEEETSPSPKNHVSDTTKNSGSTNQNSINTPVTNTPDNNTSSSVKKSDYSDTTSITTSSTNKALPVNNNESSDISTSELPEAPDLHDSNENTQIPSTQSETFNVESGPAVENQPEETVDTYDPNSLIPPFDFDNLYEDEYYVEYVWE